MALTDSPKALTPWLHPDEVPPPCVLQHRLPVYYSTGALPVYMRSEMLEIQVESSLLEYNVRLNHKVLDSVFHRSDLVLITSS